MKTLKKSAALLLAVILIGSLTGCVVGYNVVYTDEITINIPVFEDGKTLDEILEAMSEPFISAEGIGDIGGYTDAYMIIANLTNYKNKLVRGLNILDYFEIITEPYFNAYGVSVLDFINGLVPEDFSIERVIEDMENDGVLLGKAASDITDPLMYLLGRDYSDVVFSSDCDYGVYMALSGKELPARTGGGGDTDKYVFYKHDVGNPDPVGSFSSKYTTSNGYTHSYPPSTDAPDITVTNATLLTQPVWDGGNSGIQLAIYTGELAEIEEKTEIKDINIDISPVPGKSRRVVSDSKYASIDIQWFEVDENSDWSSFGAEDDFIAGNEYAALVTLKPNARYKWPVSANDISITTPHGVQLEKDLDGFNIIGIDAGGVTPCYNYLDVGGLVGFDVLTAAIKYTCSDAFTINTEQVVAGSYVFETNNVSTTDPRLSQASVVDWFNLSEQENIYDEDFEISSDWWNNELSAKFKSGGYYLAIVELVSKQNGIELDADMTVIAGGPGKIMTNLADYPFSEETDEDGYSRLYIPVLFHPAGPDIIDEPPVIIIPKVEDGCLIAASYTSDGRLLDVLVNIDYSGSVDDTKISGLDLAGAVKVKVTLWDNLNNQKPLEKAIVFTRPQINNDWIAE